MNDWFQWNGKRCTEYGIHVSDQPPLTLPAERVTFTDVPGRSGSLTTTEGEYVYEDMVLTAQCFILSGTRVPEIAAWLRGSGTVTFANRPEGYYEARIINQIPFEKILRGNPHLAFAVNFRCKPFWYQKNISLQSRQRFRRAGHHRLRHGRDHPHGGHVHHRAGGRLRQRHARHAAHGGVQ